jgi:hypothetical protein
MKKNTLLLILVCCSLLTYSQRKEGDWTIGLGVNTINSNGERSPFNNPGDWAFGGIPIAISVERMWSEDFSIEQSFTFNKFSTSNVIDRVAVPEDLSFFSTNTKIKYYYDDLIFYRSAYWLDLSVSAGIGVFSIEEINTSANLGFDAYAWLDDNWGIALKSLGKFAFNSDDKD